ncbi:MAG: GTPase Era [Candidatus Muiribacteriota bacterium]
MKKAGYVALLGRPNVGKSTLLNSILETHLSITSPKPQTTRDRIMGIYTENDVQIIFQDLPGFLSVKNKLQQKMTEDIKDGLRDSDYIVFIIESGEKTDDYADMLDLLDKREKVLIAVNKIDVDNSKNDDWEFYAKNKNWDFIQISALQEKNVKKLLEMVINNLPEMESFFYDGDYLTNRSERFIAKEYIRESALEILHDEIPHELFVDVISMKEVKDMLHIEADIIVARDSQKIIVVGRKGDGIKRLGIKSRKKIEDFFKQKVFLKLNVKVKKNWYNDQNILSNIKQDFGVWN